MAAWAKGWRWSEEKNIDCLLLFPLFCIFVLVERGGSPQDSWECATASTEMRVQPPLLPPRAPKPISCAYERETLGEAQ
jgi:hypothetical protein